MIKANISLTLILVLMPDTFSYEYLGSVKDFNMEKLELFIDKEESFMDFEQLDNLEEKFFDNNHSRLPLYNLPKRKIVKLIPKIYFAILKKDSIIYELKTDKPVLAKKKVFVKAKEVYYGGKYSHLYDKSNRAIYKTETRNLVSIDRDVKLHPTMKPYKTYKRTKHYLATDQMFTLSNHLNLSFETIDTTPLSSYLNIETTSGQANSLEYIIYPQTELSFELGIGVSLQSGKVITLSDNSDEGLPDTKWSAFYLGSYIKWNAYNYDDWSFFIGAGINRSLSYKVTHNNDIYKFENTSWKIYSEANYKTAFGTVAIGVAFINQYLYLTEESPKETQFNGEISHASTALSLYIGHRFEIDL